MDIRKHIPKELDQWKVQIQGLQEKFGQAIEEVQMPVVTPTDVPIVFVKKAKIIDILSFLKSERGFEYSFLSDLTATDESPESLRFHVVYNLYAIDHGMRIRLKVRLAEGEEVDTATVVWPAANWLEREVWDMFGVKFTGHPDLRRILMDGRWEGFPLRKDYPLRGYQIFPTPEVPNPALLED